VRGFGPREFQIDCVLGANLDPGSGGSSCLCQTPPGLGQCQRLPFTAQREKSRVVCRRAARVCSLSPMPATGGRSKSSCAPKCPKGKYHGVYFARPTAERACGKQLPADADVRLTVRFDIEDRNFHWEPNAMAEQIIISPPIHMNYPRPASPSHRAGPALRVFADAGEYIRSRSGAKTFPTRSKKPRTDWQWRRLQPRLV